MAGDSRVSELEARKRALVAESERCREALNTEVANLRHYTSGIFKTIDRVRSVSPWILMAVPLALPLLRLFRGARTPAPPTSSLKGKLAKFMLGLRLYRQYGPMVRSLVAQFQARRTAAGRASARHV